MVENVKVEADPGGSVSAAEAVSGWLVAQVMAAIWATVALSLQPGRAAGESQSSIWWFLAGGVGLWLGYLAVGVWSSIKHRRSASLLIGPPSWLQKAGIGLALGVAAQLVVVPAVYAVVGDAIEGDPEASAQTLIGLVNSTAATVALVVAVVVLAPVAEEVMYRGVLLDGLASKLGPFGSVAITSVIFALAHGELILLPGLLVFAIILGLLAHWSEGLLAPIAAHMAFNATTVFILLTG